MNEGGAARRQFRSYVFGAVGPAAVVSLAACSGGTSIGGQSGAGSGGNAGASSGASSGASASPYGFSTPTFSPVVSPGAAIQLPQLALATIISISPVLVIFGVAQRFLVTGLTAGATKG